jgi:hypothetical protein
MKFTRFAFVFAALSIMSVSAMAETAPAATELAPFGVTQYSNLDALGCKVFQDDLYDCKAFPEKNSEFSTYTVETRSGPRDGICNVTAFTQAYRGDYRAVHVMRTYDRLNVLLERKYGVANKSVDGQFEGNLDLAALEIMLGTKAFSKVWNNNPKLPHGTSIKMKVTAISDEKTFVELTYFLGGPGCSTEEDQALKGL